MLPRTAALGLALAVAVATRCRERASAPQPPAVDAGPDLRTYPGRPTAVTLRVAGAGQFGRPWSYTIDWGDDKADTGTVQLGGPAATATHAYTVTGRYRVRVMAADQSGATSADTLTAYVDPRSTPQVLVGAGDIGDCGRGDAAATARILDTIPGAVFTAGDNAYPHGSPRDYANCYTPSWGRHKKRTHPALGNHDYDTHGAAGYFNYFGVAAGDSGLGYYSYDLGAWHVAVLNSNVDMTPGSPQERWLRADLAAHPAHCTLAFFHHPLFSSGTTHGSQSQTRPLWRALYEAGADVVISAHEHNYERFGPQTPDGAWDSARGIREFVVGTGGGEHYRLGSAIANSEARDTEHGVLKLSLSRSGYAWRFIPIPGGTFSDSGAGVCH